MHERLLKLSYSPVHWLIAVQVILLLLGVFRWNFNLSLVDIVSVLVASIATEYLFARRLFFPSSAIATALGLLIFLRTANPLYFVLAGCVAIASKYIIKPRGRGHIFNPSNLAIVVLVFLFPSSATIEFTQWGDSIIVYTAVASAIMVVAYRARVLATTVSFIASYALLVIALLPRYTDIVSVHNYGLLSPSLLLFAAFMITDPKTSPTRTSDRIKHGVSVALLLFTLEIIGVRYAIFLASFLITFLNAFAYFAPERMRSRISMHTLTMVVAGVALCVSIFFTPAHSPRMYAPIPSIDFMLRGIESPSLRACSNSAVLRPSSTAVLGAGSNTFGAAWGDYNSDGYDDLFVSNSSGGVSALYHNNSDGTFSDVTLSAGLPIVNSTSAMFADYDNDGNLDLFVSRLEYADNPALASPFELALGTSTAFQVYHNNGDGTYTNVTSRLGFDTAIIKNYTGASFSFGDYNRDGYLDFVFASGGVVFPAANTNTALLKSLFDPRFDDVTSVVCDKNQIMSVYGELGSRAYGTRADVERFVSAGGCLIVNDSLELISMSGLSLWSPGAVLDAVWLMPGSVHLFENNRGENFSEHVGFEASVLDGQPTEETYTVQHMSHPFDRISRHYFQPISFDYDADGAQDIFITSGWGANILMKNMGEFTFENVTTEAGFDYAGSGMGVDIAHLDGVGAPSVLTTNVLRDYLFSADSSGLYELSHQRFAQLGLGWGVSFLDYNLDGKSDIFITNGDVSRIAWATNGSLSRSLYRADALYRNNGTASFEDVTWEDVCPVSGSGRALAISDFDNNGTPDVFVGNVVVSEVGGGENVLYVNQTSGLSYLKIRLNGTESNSFGIGAIISVTAGTSTQAQTVLAGGSYYSQNSSRLVFGLGSYRDTVRIRVEWPSGNISTVTTPELNREIIINENY